MAVVFVPFYKFEQYNLHEPHRPITGFKIWERRTDPKTWVLSSKNCCHIYTQSVHSKDFTLGAVH